MGSWSDHYFRTAFSEERPREIKVGGVWASRSAHMRRLKAAGKRTKEALTMTRDLPPSHTREKP